MKIQTRLMTQAAIIAAAYVVMTLPFAQLSFGGPFQFRLSESLTVLAALTPAAVPGLFLGCFLANLFNPQSLGIIDIVFGSLATLLAASLTFHFYRRLGAKRDQFRHTLWLVSPSVIINAVVVGLYLPILLPNQALSAPVILGFMGSIGLSQAFVVYVIGVPLLLSLRKAFAGKNLSGLKP